jgi:hypothetical protein
MTTNSYIVLRSSDQEIGKKFKAIQYAPSISRKGNVTQTSDGLSVVIGISYDVHNMTLKVTDEVDDSDYGTRADLETYYRLNNPNGNPSCVLEYTDHYGTEWNAVLIGDLAAQAVTTIIEGTLAYFYIPVQILLLGEIISS